MNFKINISCEANAINKGEKIMQKKYTYFIGVIISLILASGLAQADNCCQPALNKIVLQLQTEAWATTNTANAVVNINATIDKGDVTKLRGEILDKLAKVAPGDWHITSFNQSQTESGLEQVYASAELRLPQKDLANIRVQAKAVSRPGLDFKVGGIDFNPSLDELENTRNDLRVKIYNQVNAEIERLHKVNPTQNYSVHLIDFVRIVQAAPMMAGGNFLARAAGDRMEAATMLPVSNKIQMMATVELVPEPMQKTIASK